MSESSTERARSSDESRAAIGAYLFAPAWTNRSSGDEDSPRERHQRNALLPGSPDGTQTN
jgi:hypothetical protein